VSLGPGPATSRGAPFGEVGALGAEDGVVAVAGVDLRRVRQGADDLALKVVIQRCEARRVLLGIARATRETTALSHRAGPVIKLRTASDS
jgi:hypothetical protein